MRAANRLLRLSKAEVEANDRAIFEVARRVVDHFPSVGEHFVFGSYRYHALLPRSIDPSGDLDYMVVFNDPRQRPDFYLRRLRTFCNARIRGFDVDYDHPSIILRNEDVNFDLVPAIKLAQSAYLIPKSRDEWIETQPLHNAQNFISSECEESMALRLLKYVNLKHGNGIAPYVIRDLVVAELANYRNPRLGGTRSGRKFSSAFSRLLATYVRRFGINGGYSSLVTRSRTSYSISDDLLMHLVSIPHE